MSKERRELPSELEPIRAYIESIKPWDEPLEEILADTTRVQINAPRALIACEFKGFVFMLAKAVRLKKVRVVKGPYVKVAFDRRTIKQPRGPRVVERP